MDPFALKLMKFCTRYVFQINLFISDALHMLLALDLPASVSLQQRLGPVQQFMATHTAALRQWLLPETYTRLMRKLWTCVVKVSGKGETFVNCTLIIMTTKMTTSLSQISWWWQWWWLGS